jgi:hypothetical protein
LLFSLSASPPRPSPSLATSSPPFV